MTTDDTLDALGFAPVIAVLGRGGEIDSRESTARVRAHFSGESASQLGRASLAATATGPDVAGSPDAVRIYPHLGVAYGTVTREGLAALDADPAVDRVRAAPQLSPIRPVRSAPAELTGPHTWGLTALGIPDLWAAGLTGAGVAVAHLDTGVDATHPALRDAVADFAELDHAGRLTGDTTPIDTDAEDAHGTHTAATLAGRPVDARHVGVAPGALLHCAAVIEGGDLVARIIGGMDWAVGGGVRVLSLSLGIRGWVVDFLEIVDILRDNGVLPVIACGNEGAGSSRSPGNYPTALSVGAHDEHFAVAETSSSQRFRRTVDAVVPDVVAPGVDVVSAGPGGTWWSRSGTSMATPHVAGLAALLLEAEPAATVDELEQALFASAQGHDMDPERTHRGALDGPRALAALTDARRGAVRG